MSNKLMSKSDQQNPESGMVAIVVTVIIMIVLSLIVLAFSRIARNNQRQALDRQLHTQAFYAAESGINDAIDELNKPLSPYRTTEKDNCNPITGYNNVLDGGASSYSCLLIDPTPTSLEFGSIGIGESKAVPIQRQNGTAVNQLSIHWQDTSDNEVFTGCPAAAGQFFSTWDAACSPGILRIDLVETGTGAVSRTALINNTMTAFFTPGNSGGVASLSFAAAVGFGGQGATLRTICNIPNTAVKPKHCSAVITNLASSKYFMRITALYKTANVTVCTPSCGVAATIPFAEGAQIKIDSTGKISDILRRIQVHVSTSDLGLFPGYAIESSETLCKRFSIAPPNIVDGDTAAHAACEAP